MKGTRAERIRARLERVFAPSSLEIVDDSARHAGHAERVGASRPGRAEEVGETHFRIRMVSASFAGMSRVARSRAVHEALAEEFATGLHALGLELRAPGEA
ncbi:MAG: BolA family transcriptional regulator [Elioraea sp.]|nr:BolA family transcriptional regulator [Elioraea sp.]